MTEAACWAHGRRKLFTLAQLAKAPIAAEAVRRIDAIFDAERDINGTPAVERQAGPAEAHSAAGDQLWRLGCGPSVASCRGIPTWPRRWTICSSAGLPFTRFLDDGRICLTNNAAERALRGIAIGREAWLFAGFRPRGRAGGGDLHADRHRQAERAGPSRLARRRAAPHRRPPGIAPRRVAALELRGTGCQTGGMSPSKTLANDTSAADSFNQICTVRIELLDTDPLIWREAEVPTSITLKVLHDIVQITMGWLDQHLWEFKIDGSTYGLPMDEDWGTAPRTQAIKIRLRDVLKPRRTTIHYTYDFGDSWDHKIIVTKVRPGAPGVSYPNYVAGEWDCPPEDCGGIPAITTCSTPSPIPSIPIMLKSPNTSKTGTPRKSTNCPFGSRSAALQTDATPPERKLPKRRPDPQLPRRSTSAAALGGWIPMIRRRLARLTSVLTRTHVPSGNVISTLVSSACGVVRALKPGVAAPVADRA